MTDLVQEGWAVVDRLYDRLRTQAARGLDVDAAVVLTQCVEALEQQMAAREEAHEQLDEGWALVGGECQQTRLGDTNA